MAYRLKRDRIIHGTTFGHAGDVVYPILKCDYGCASDDTRGFGVEHISVTHDPGGGYPFFTVAVADLEPVA